MRQSRLILSKQQIILQSGVVHIAQMKVRTVRTCIRRIRMQRGASIPQIRALSTSRDLRNGESYLSVTDRFSMREKTVLVTGGGRGIGFAICKAVAQLGGNVAVLDCLSEPVEEFHSLGSQYGIKSFYRQADVTQKQSLEDGFAWALEKAGSFEGCVTAAGIALDKPFLDHAWEECHRVLNVNVMGTFWASKLCAAHMVKRGNGGSIVMIASIAGQGVKVPEQNLAIYNMSKAAVKGLVGPLAVELAEAKIRVNSISPGVIMSPMTDALKTQYPHLLKMFQQAAPLKRIGLPSDLTPLAAYLLSDASSFTTGSDFPVTGGMHVGISPSYISQTAS